jgi:hypothetical protein
MSRAWYAVLFGALLGLCWGTAIVVAAIARLFVATQVAESVVTIPAARLGDVVGALEEIGFLLHLFLKMFFPWL